MNSLRNEGFWGKQTATIDWCEINYEVTYYIAEFWNTISNLVMILFPLYGMYWSFKHIVYANKNSNTKTTYFSIPATIIWCHIGLIVVGLGSWMFHMTLLYPMQLLDELPMIFGSGILVYANYDLILLANRLQKQTRLRTKTNPKFKIIEKLFENRQLVFILISLYCIVVTYVYVSVWKNPIFHEIAYGIQVFIVIAENITLIKKFNLSKRLYVTSLFYYLLGFILWNIDNKFCDYLQLYRSNVEKFFGISNVDLNSGIKPIALNVVAVSLKSISELHSLWHIFTGYAAYMTILFLTEVHYEHHLKLYKQTHPEHLSNKRPVQSKFYNLYYNFSESLINEKKNQNNSSSSSSKSPSAERSNKKSTKKFY